jgi:hypothetical protein
MAIFSTCALVLLVACRALQGGAGGAGEGAPAGHRGGDVAQCAQRLARRTPSAVRWLC